jgi:Tol biopolymer transport system component
MVAATPATGDTVTTRVVEAAGGVAPDRGAVDPEITPDGRHLVFRSRSSNLVPVSVLPFTTPNVLDPQPRQPAGEDLDLIDDARDDVLVRDLETGAISISSVDSSGTGGGLDSAAGVATPDGRFVVFDSLSNDFTPGTGLWGGRHVFRKDRQTGELTFISQTSGGTRGQGSSGGTAPTISADGSVVAWYSSATDTVPGDTNGRDDVFVRDITAGTTVRASEPAGGGNADGSSSAPLLSGDGQLLFFSSLATDLVPGDTNAVQDVFVLDRGTGTLGRVLVGVGGSQPNAGVYLSSISPDGRYLAIESAATNLDPAAAGITSSQVFVHDRVLGTTTLASGGLAGALPTSSAGSSDIDAAGRFVAFQSGSTNLVAGDTNGRDDVFVRDLRNGTTTRVSLDPDGSERDGTSWNPSITGDGSQVVYAFQPTGSGVFDIYRAVTAAEPPVVVLPEPEYSGLLVALAAAIPELEVVTTTATTFGVPGGCTSPLPAGAGADYLSALAGDPYPAVGGGTAPPLSGPCVPDAVTTGTRP